MHGTPGMRSLALIPALLLAACAPRTAPRSSPPADAVVPTDAAVAGGPQHHCADLTPVSADDVAAAADVIPIRADAAVAAAERAAFDAARPVFARYCWRCHAGHGKKTKASTLARLDMTSYPFASSHGDAIAAHIRVVLGLDGSAPSMPLVARGCVPAADLERVAAWADAVAAAPTTAP